MGSGGPPIPPPRLDLELGLGGGAEVTQGPPCSDALSLCRTLGRSTCCSSWAPHCRCSPLHPSSAGETPRARPPPGPPAQTLGTPCDCPPSHRVPTNTPRLLINKEKTGQVSWGGGTFKI